MAACPACGTENSAGAKFCNECAAPLTGEGREQRKTVTVLFCDVTGSTALGESTDPEALRALLARYFERMKGIVESHGGTVEKFIGDAVMAVFGVPVAHEDDALRACRAAVEMRYALPELGISGRIGVNTGEVVTGTAERLATGDAVNVAARFEQAAEPREVLIGEGTYALVRDAVEAEPMEPLTLKGKAEPVPAYRLVSVLDAPERSHSLRFVGREAELTRILAAWDRAEGQASCELVTIVGDAGVGKSRLVAEFLDGIETRAVRGRCLTYGEGITYWPVVEVLKQLNGLPSDPAGAAALRSLLGESGDATTAEEIAWAFRTLLEERAPLVCVFDDVHWGEETLLDLIDHLALLSRGAPILLICLARSEVRWPTTLRLEPLGDEEVVELIGTQVGDELRGRIARAAGGNPLFVTEMLAMAGETGGEVGVPPSLQALLAARIDSLEGPERRVLESGAIEGEVFHRGAVQALSSEEEPVTPRLAALARKQLIRPEKAQLPGEDGFRFRHLLIRDAAYEALPKATRAELHVRFAGWLEEHGVGTVELDELLGYHLEQAVRYKRELGQADSGLAERAGERLVSAGRRVLWRGDRGAALGLFERALALLRPLRLDVGLELDFAEVQPTSRQAVMVAEAAAERAGQEGDAAGEAVARVVAALSRLQAGEAEVDELDRLAHSALPLLERAGDHRGLARIWHALGFGVANTRGRFEDCARAAERAREEWRLAGVPPTDGGFLGMALILGPRPADEALEALDATLPETPHPNPLGGRAWLLGMLGRLDEAEALAAHASERSLELIGDYGVTDWTSAEIAALAGDHERAARHLDQRCKFLEAAGNQAALSTFAPRLALELCELGRFDEAEQLALKGRDLGDEHDAYTQALWRQALARVHSHRGDHGEAERIAYEAVGIADESDSPIWQAAAHDDLARVLAEASRPEEAAAVLRQALARYERKGVIPAIERTRARLAEIQT